MGQAKPTCSEVKKAGEEAVALAAASSTSSATPTDFTTHHHHHHRLHRSTIAFTHSILFGSARRRRPALLRRSRLAAPAATTFLPVAAHASADTLAGSPRARAARQLREGTGVEQAERRETPAAWRRTIIQLHCLAEQDWIYVPASVHMSMCWRLQSRHTTANTTYTARANICVIAQLTPRRCRISACCRVRRTGTTCERASWPA